MDRLRSFPFISADNIENMKGGLPDYPAGWEDTHAGKDVVSWWKGHPEAAC